MYGSDEHQECSSNRRHGRPGPTPRGDDDRRTRDVDERLECCEAEHGLARESSHSKRSQSLESVAREREVHATDRYSRESSVRASPRGVYVWEDDLCENYKDTDRTESVRGSMCTREKSFSRSPRASMSLPKPRESVRREERCSVVPSDRCSHRESRSQPRGTEVTEVQRSEAASRASRRSACDEPERSSRQSCRTSGVEDVTRCSKSYKDEKIDLGLNSGDDRLLGVSDARSSQRDSHPSQRPNASSRQKSQGGRPTDQRVSFCGRHSHRFFPSGWEHDEEICGGLMQSNLENDGCQGSARHSVADSRRNSSTKTLDYAQVAPGDESDSHASLSSHGSHSEERQRVRRRSSMESQTAASNHPARHF
eukprot:CAMPEP_0194513742 /NCGR_PEP_ID=MMETSP0253-20130528/46087_1 /TAXON_ID=2966 /ORGANISM="Noctiluca scintillans" /LENGTH=366 /DNA_ID=CAMNT_0039357323 /DNA_START=197 /DNA_END=1297 /DNA_ORIENTATION=-